MGPLSVRIFANGEELGKQAALAAASIIRDTIHQRSRVRLVFSAANSQLAMVKYLIASPGIDWGSAEIFHVDEYVGVSIDHPASFARWVREHVVERVHPGKVHYLAGDASDREAECQRYGALLSAAPIDLTFLGIGENGHIGFNDPHAADFNDPRQVKSVTLDERCRLQQVNEGHWPDLDAVIKEGLTLTCPTLVSATDIICCVPGQRKAEAVRNALQGPIAPSCPGSLLRTHPRATLFLDVESASLL